MKKVSIFGQVKEALKEYPMLWEAIRKEANHFVDKDDQEDFLLSILAYIRFGADRTKRGTLPKWMIEKIQNFQKIIKSLNEYETTSFQH